MLAFDRQKKILELMKDAESVRTVEIASVLDVTDETIRKDFESLERRGELVRIHGGATRANRIREAIPLMRRQEIRQTEKQAIAVEAAKRIQANETIFLDASSTTLTLARFLPNLPLTVLTNAHDVFAALANRTDVDLICTGGRYDAASRSYIGLLAERALRRYDIHRVFFSGDGVHIQRGVSESNSRQAAFKERVVEQAGDVVLLADHTKLGQKAPFFFAQTSQVSCLITDAAADAEFVETIREHDVEAILA